jgi:hypothetical protein
MAAPSDTRATVCYVAAGYKLPAGIEAYLLHYATELRSHGFDTRIVVFASLPREEHRFLRALRERGIPIESLYHDVRWAALTLTAAAWLPWAVGRMVSRRGAECAEAVEMSDVRGQKS